MFKTRSVTPGQAPATLTPHLVDGKTVHPKITLFEYDEVTLVEKEIANIEDAFGCFHNDKVSWINIDGLGDVDVLRKLGERFNLHPLALEDVLNTGQRPKVEHYEGYLFIVAEMIYLNKEEEVCGEQVSMFLGRNFIITVQEEPETDAFDHVRARIRSGRGWIRKMKCDYLAYALLDSIIDHYFPVLENLGAAIEDIENTMVEKPSRSCLLSLHEYKRTLVQMRRFVWPAREVATSLMHEETGLVRAETKVFLRDCYDHTVQIMDLVESYRDVVSGLMELYLSSIGIRTNEIMRVLTVMSSIFIPLTFIAGLYGMNFAYQEGDVKMPLNMPELHSPYGYVIVLGVMVLIAIGQVLFFKHKKWL
ncbi:MAG: magnesium/cobalt transporter CorA [Chthoniobacter sp.]|uniref:magnesium/cobalt transporter CorA n=1 Tax=Chthoniobacter sp. TaxID=2510640 RepID=UPI0032ACD81E